MSPELKRRFRIWGLGLLIVFALASTVFVIRVARQPSEPFISVSFDHTYPPVISIEVSNRISFDVDCWLEPIEVLRSGNWVPVMSDSSGFFRGNYFLKAHSKISPVYERSKFPNSPSGYTVYKGNNPYHARFMVFDGDWVVINGYLIKYDIKPMNTNATDIWIPLKDITIITDGP